MLRRTERARLAHDPQRDRGGKQIAHDRHKADQAVDAVADLGARQHEGDIEQFRQRIDPRKALLARQRRPERQAAQTLKVDAGTGRAECPATAERPAAECAVTKRTAGTHFVAVLIDDLRTPRAGAARGGAVEDTVVGHNGLSGHKGHK